MSKEVKKVDTWVECPYYKYDTKQVIHCEGVENGLSTNIAFAAADMQHSYKEIYCRKHWQKCRVVDMLNRKYDHQ